MFVGVALVISFIFPRVTLACGLNYPPILMGSAVSSISRVARLSEPTTDIPNTSAANLQNALALHPRHPVRHQSELPLSLESLPDELLELVLDALSGDDLARVSCSCRRLRALANDDGRWIRCLVADYGHTFAPPVGVEFPLGAIKDRYVQCRETLRAIMRRREQGIGEGMPPEWVGGRVYYDG